MNIPDYTSAPATQAFHRALHEQHLEDGAFLYEQRRDQVWRPATPWGDLGTIEDRLDAHIDALVAGEEPALAMCADRAPAGDPGEVFVAVSAFCRSRQAPLLAATLRALDLENYDVRVALTDALKCWMPDDWRDYCVRATVSGAPKLLSTLAHVMGHRRWVADDIIIHRFKDADRAALPALLWALGRTGGPAAMSFVRSLLDDADESIAAAAFHAALRLETGEAIHYLLAPDTRRGIGPIPLGLAGGRRMAAVLIPALGNAKEFPEIVTAVGLLGDLSAVRPLVELLSVEEVAESAAEALYVIVGAPLFEEVLVPDPVSEDEMLEQEIAEYHETGELPRRPDGEPFGTRVRRLARDPEVWSDWLNGNASGFVAGQRYRLGEPCTPRLLLECLRDETFPKRYRPWVAEELQIRYRVDLPFEVDMFVAEQRRVLDAAVAAMAGGPVEFEPGQWHFAAHPTF